MITSENNRFVTKYYWQLFPNLENLMQRKVETTILGFEIIDKKSDKNWQKKNS